MTSAISKRAFVRSQLAEVDLAVARVQEAARDSLQRVIDGGLLKGRLIESVAVDAGGVSIAHGLGRRPLGWIVADINTNAFVHRTAWDARTITLAGSKAATISVWVY
jgi:hypothetical protein